MVKEIIAAGIITSGLTMAGIGYLPDAIDRYLELTVKLNANRVEELADLHFIVFKEFPDNDTIIKYVKLTGYETYIDGDIRVFTLNKQEVNGCHFYYNPDTGKTQLSNCKFTNEIKDNLTNSFNSEL